LLTLTRTLLTPVVLALAVAAVVSFVLVVVLRGHSSAPTQPLDTTTGHQTAGIDWARVVPTLSCGGGVATVVDSRVVSDLDGDGRPDAVIAAHCDAGAGSPPSVVQVLLDRGGRPRLLGELVTPAQDLLVRRLALRGDLVELSAQGYSPGTPRCCPDRALSETWRVRTGSDSRALQRVH